MRKFLFCFILVASISSLQPVVGITITSVCDGNWSDSTTWDVGVPGLNDNVVINHLVRLDVNVSLILPAYLLINSSGELCGHKNFGGRFVAQGPMKVNNLWSYGACINTAIVITAGNYTGVNGTWTMAGPIIFGGSFSCPIPNYCVLPTADFEISDTIICASTCAYFTNQTGSGISYQWLFPGANPDSSNVKHPGPICYPVSGTYDVTLIATNLLGADTITKSFNITVLPSPVVDLGPDTIICYGDSILLDAGNTGCSYLWSNGNTTQTLYAKGNSYTVTVTEANGCSTVGQINITSIPSINIAGYTTSCAGDTVQITASGGPNYQWSTGDTTSVTYVAPLVTTTYYLTITEGICSAVDSQTINVTGANYAQLLENDSVVCPGAPRELVAAGGDSYLWENGSTNDTIVVMPVEDREYYVTITNACGQFVHSIPVLVLPPPPVNAGLDTTILLGNQAVLKGNGGNTWAWSPVTGLVCPHCSTTTASLNQTTTYYLTVTDENGCTAMDNVTVYVDATCSYFVPNVFSPNGDGNNDQLFFRGKNYTLQKFIIYDRWGKKVFEGSDSNTGWDGLLFGQSAMEGVYVYYLEAECANGEILRHQGNVTLVR